jgi:hypothetical protein
MYGDNGMIPPAMEEPPALERGAEAYGQQNEEYHHTGDGDVRSVARHAICPPELHRRPHQTDRRDCDQQACYQMQGTRPTRECPDAHAECDQKYVIGDEKRIDEYVDADVE